jgi:hypothetical protein
MLKTRSIFQVAIGCLFALLLVSCEEVVRLTIVAPQELEGARLLIDGKDWGGFTSRGVTSEIEVDVPPYWNMHMQVVKPGFATIEIAREYRGTGRRTLQIEKKQVKPLRPREPQATVPPLTSVS